MQYRVDHDLHIHSGLSLCSKDPEQNKERLLRYAQENGFRDIAVTDHYWDSAVPSDNGFYQTQNFDHIAEILPLPEAEGVRFHFGCETDLDRFGVLGIPESRYDDFDFIIIPTTHLHMDANIFAQDKASTESRARVYVEHLDWVLDRDLPFYKIGIAHLTCPLAGADRNHPEEVPNAISDDTYRRLFDKIARRGCGVELNMPFEKYEGQMREDILRPYRIAKECGCRFYFGSDAHHPNAFDIAKDRFTAIRDALDLTENDRFDPFEKE